MTILIVVILHYKFNITRIYTFSQPSLQLLFSHRYDITRKYFRDRALANAQPRSDFHARASRTGGFHGDLLLLPTPLAVVV